jgi:Transposase DDE domain group 1
MRVFARRERPHPGAQLSLFETEDGHRYSLWVTNLPVTLRGWRASPAYIDGAHRVHAQVEDGIRTGKDCGIGRFPSQAIAMNKAWFSAALIAATLLAWLRLLALDGHLAGAEPKILRHKILHAAARITRGGRQRQLRIQATWPWQPTSSPPSPASAPSPTRPDRHRECPSRRPRHHVPWSPGHPARQPGHRHDPALKSASPAPPDPRPPATGSGE